MPERKHYLHFFVRCSLTFGWTHQHQCQDYQKHISIIIVLDSRPQITWLKDGIELNSHSEHEHVSSNFTWNIWKLHTGNSRVPLGHESHVEALGPLTSFFLPSALTHVKSKCSNHPHTHTLDGCLCSLHLRRGNNCSPGTKGRDNSILGVGFFYSLSTIELDIQIYWKSSLSSNHLQIFEWQIRKNEIKVTIENFEKLLHIEDIFSQLVQCQVMGQGGWQINFTFSDPVNLFNTKWLEN